MNNVKPRDRQQRDQQLDKDIIEKTYINNRIGYETRNQDVKKLLYQAEVGSSLRITENERFDKDFAVFDKYNRDSRTQRVLDYQERNRYAIYDRDVQRWKNQEKKELKESDKLNFKKESIFIGKRNINYQGFNPINNHYENTILGKSLFDKEQSLQINYLLRQNNLQQKNNQSFNIITGEKNYQVPAFLLDKYDSNTNFQNQFQKTEF